MRNQSQSVEEQHRILRVVWLVVLFSQAMFLAAIFLSKPEVFRFDFGKPLLGENPIIVFLFAVLAIINFAVSFVMKKRCLEQAFAERKYQYVQTGLIVACALCEIISILGMILAFGFSYQFFFLWFALAIAGIILHYPKRRNVSAANSKK